jgi:hypothetical protein
MISVKIEKNGEADFIVKVSIGELYFSKRALIELRDKINRALEEFKRINNVPG